jgi:hypothetical protein
VDKTFVARRIVLPCMPRSERDGAIAFEIEKSSPYRVADMFYAALPAGRENGLDAYNVFLLRRDAVAREMDLAEGCGLVVTGVVPLPLALLSSAGAKDGSVTCRGVEAWTFRLARGRIVSATPGGGERTLTTEDAAPENRASTRRMPLLTTALAKETALAERRRRRLALAATGCLLFLLGIGTAAHVEKRACDRREGTARRRLAALSADRTAAELELARLVVEHQGFLAERYRVVCSAAPRGVRFTALACADAGVHTIRVEGKARGDADVSELLDNLSRTGMFGKVELEYVGREGATDEAGFAVRVSWP